MLLSPSIYIRVESRFKMKANGHAHDTHVFPLQLLPGVPSLRNVRYIKSPTFASTSA